jgi:hypothetical protein
VKRSTTAGGPYATIATNLATLSYEDTNTSANTLYYYVVSATDNGLESVNSSESSASMSAAPGTSWLSQDVGAVGVAGAFSQSNGTFTVNGSGADIWYGTDELRYVFQAVRGNYLFTARVLNMQNTANCVRRSTRIPSASSTSCRPRTASRCNSEPPPALRRLESPEHPDLQRRIG